MNDLAARLNQLMVEQRKEVKDVQQALGITYEMARRYKLGTATPRADKLEKLAEFFNVEPSWLLYGIGDNDISTTQDETHKHRIDYLDVRAAAGLNGFENTDYPEIISSLFLTADGMRLLVGKTSADGIYMITVPTDSMEPTIKKGDIVLIDTRIDYYSGDGVYAFTVDGALFIKRMQKLIGGGYRLISDNTIYPSEVIDESVTQNAKFVGRFIRVMRIGVEEL